MRVEGFREWLQPSLENSVVLHGLTGRESDRSVGEIICDSVECEPLRGSHMTARNGHTDHEDVVKVLFREGALASDITIVLRVDPMEFHEVFARGGDIWAIVSQLFGKISAQVGALLFDLLNHGESGGIVRHLFAFHLSSAAGLAARRLNMTYLVNNSRSADGAQRELFR